MSSLVSPRLRSAISTLALSTASLTVTVPVFAAPTTAPVSSKPTIERYIVQIEEEGALTRQTFRAALKGKVSRLGRTITGMNCAVVEATPAQMKALAADGRIVSVTADRAVRGEALPPLDLNRVAVGADQVNGYSGYSGSETGAGIGVAVIDSGISTAHPDLFLRVAGFKDYVNGYTAPYDDYGHGSHVAGLIGGSGAAGLLTGAGQNYRGIAPAAHFVGLKVLDANGVGRVSDVIAALDWCIANKTLYNLRVVNLSLSTVVISSAETDPLCQAAERAVDAGLVVVAAAGNVGGAYGTVGAPGNDPKVITVGASNTRGTTVRGDDVITSFSGRGPTRYDVAIKPDLVAPGNDIVSLRTPGGTLDTVYSTQTRVDTTPYYSRLSGTSMSSALVAGAATVMIDANNKLTPNAVKAALMYTAKLLSGYDSVTDKTAYFDPFSQGTGELNVVGAVELGKRIKKNSGFNGTLPISSLIAGEVSPWAGAVIPTILIRPGLTWSESLLFGGNTGLTVAQARDVWGSNVVWGGVGGETHPPVRTLWSDSLVYGSNIVWGGNTGGPPPPPLADTHSLVWADNIVWGGGGVGWPIPSVTDSPGTVNADNIVWGGNTGGGTPPSREDPIMASNLVWGGNTGGGKPPTRPVEPDPEEGMQPGPAPSP
ncbi:MAG: S8 family peptidase [Armatimonadetes bacterium]|nr:S8 family peptidase [Armatimonadota bacterium]